MRCESIIYLMTLVTQLLKSAVWLNKIINKKLRRMKQLCCNLGSYPGVCLNRLRNTALSLSDT
jgi:hypothetical protein